MSGPDDPWPDDDVPRPEPPDDPPFGELDVQAEDPTYSPPEDP